MSAWTTFTRRWEQFFYAQASPAALGLFRILFAYCLWHEVDTTRARSDFAVAGGFHLPYVPFIQPVPEHVFAWLHDLQYPFILLFGLGAFTRSSCAVLLGLQGWVFFADVMNFRNHPYFFLLLLILMMLSSARDSLSARALRPMLMARRFSFAELLGPASPLTWQRLIQLQVCIAYLYAALHKIHPWYLQGEVLSNIVSTAVLPFPGGALLERWLGTEVITAPENLIAPAIATIALELVLPFALWFRRTRLWAIAVGVAFHSSIMFLMNINEFSLAMMASYLLFLEPDRVRATLAGAAERLSRHAKLAPAQTLPS